MLESNISPMCATACLNDPRGWCVSISSSFVDRDVRGVRAVHDLMVPRLSPVIQFQTYASASSSTKLSPTPLCFQLPRIRPAMQRTGITLC